MDERVEIFLRLIGEKLTPLVLEEVARSGSGNFEIHYADGAFTRVNQTRKAL